nr:uncharacterized protein CI109_007480 [Kwoniella shandongensis]KAA5524198.1 hypothetical protein CI109_007480 [Kwoniella shandongensis]
MKRTISTNNQTFNPSGALPLSPPYSPPSSPSPTKQLDSPVASISPILYKEASSSTSKKSERKKRSREVVDDDDDESVEDELAEDGPHAAAPSTPSIRWGVRLVVDGCDLYRAAAPTAADIALIKCVYLPVARHLEVFANLAIYLHLPAISHPTHPTHLVFLLDCRGSIIRYTYRSSRFERSVLPEGAKFRILHRVLQKDSAIGGHKVPAEYGGVVNFAEVEKESLAEVKRVLDEDWASEEWREELWNLVRLLDRIRTRETVPNATDFGYRLLLDNHVILLAALGLYEDLLPADVFSRYTKLYREITILMSASILSNSPSIYGLVYSATVLSELDHLYQSRSTSRTFKFEMSLLEEILIISNGLFVSAVVGCQNTHSDEQLKERVMRSWWLLRAPGCHIGSAGPRVYRGGDVGEAAGDAGQGHEVRRSDVESGAAGAGRQVPV